MPKKTKKYNKDISHFQKFEMLKTPVFIGGVGMSQPAK